MILYSILFFELQDTASENILLDNPPYLDEDIVHQPLPKAKIKLKNTTTKKVRLLLSTLPPPAHKKAKVHLKTTVPPPLTSTQDQLEADVETTTLKKKSKAHLEKTTLHKAAKTLLENSTLPPPTHKPTKHKRSLYPYLDMESPPVQPLSPFFLEIREKDDSFNRIQKLRELITDASNELEVPKSISSRMTLEKVVNAVKLCRTMTYIDISKTAAIISLQSQNNRMLLTERFVFIKCIVNQLQNSLF